MEFVIGSGKIGRYIREHAQLATDKDIASLYESMGTDGRLKISAGSIDLRKLSQQHLEIALLPRVLSGAIKIMAVSFGLDASFPTVVTMSGEEIDLSKGVPYVREREISDFISKQCQEGRVEVRTFFACLDDTGHKMLTSHDAEHLCISRIAFGDGESFPEILVGCMVTISTFMREYIFPKLNGHPLWNIQQDAYYYRSATCNAPC